VQRVLDELVERDIERGLQVAAYHGGELIVDAWSGLADAETSRRVDGDTLFFAWSVSKGVAITLVHMLAERGKLEYDVPIAEYWPGFGKHGKDRITLRQILTHTAGIPHLPDGLTWAQFCDWEYMCRAMEDAEPLWAPGTAMSYHAWTMGWLLGHVAECVDDRPFPTQVYQDVCRPLGISTLYFGIPDAVAGLVAREEDGPGYPALAEEGTLSSRTTPPPFVPSAALTNRDDVQRSCQPAGAGVMNARAVARIYASLAGALPDVQLLPPERVRIATELQTELAESASAAGEPIALGYWRGEPGGTPNPPSTAFGHGGAGGSMALGDPARRLSFALLKNRMVDRSPGQNAVELVWGELMAALEDRTSTPQRE
jgi:CubicO group peptidase (beta-lactamase class C family)